MSGLWSYLEAVKSGCASITLALHQILYCKYGHDAFPFHRVDSAQPDMTQCSTIWSWCFFITREGMHMHHFPSGMHAFLSDGVEMQTSLLVK